jgi:sugar lactone lactonase YvrE
MSQFNLRGILCMLGLLVFSACGTNPPAQPAFQATLPATITSAPLYTAAPTDTPTDTPTPSPTPGPPPPYVNPPAEFSATSGWSCEDFPCENDLDGFLQRIRVPAGYALEHVGQFPAQPMQITYGPDGRLYATALENGTRIGAVYVMNADGSTQRYTSGLMISPIGLAFQPGTDLLYVSGRVAYGQGGALWRVYPGGGQPELVINNLPCCFGLIDNQPNGITFGPDGYLYLGIGALTDHSEVTMSDPKLGYTSIQPLEAGILRIQPDTGEITAYAQGLRNPYDLAFDSTGQLYATDSGTVYGPVDRLLSIQAGAHYGWPYWRERGCAECPLNPGGIPVSPDWLTFPDFTLPRGLTIYNGDQFPLNLKGSLFVALWNGTANAQRIVRIDPHDPNLGISAYTPEPFVTGLVRPVDVTVASDGALVVADFIYGHVWRVRYVGSR